ncbi:MAG: shikimate dehydrogenase [Pseudomonadota bacterium]
MIEITGNTRLYGIVADPVAQVKTPQTMRKVFERRGTDGVLVPIHVPPAGLADVVQAIRSIKNFGGMVVTVPHKTSMVELCDVVTAEARAVGAVNIVRREPDGTLAGDILDGKGFVEGLRQNGFKPEGLTVLLCGAGGAARAIAFALAQAGIRKLSIHNRTQAAAQQILQGIKTLHPAVETRLGSEDPTGFDLVVNATSLGMRAEDPLPLDASRLSATQAVAEIIMTPKLTPLLEQAQAKGCRIQYGLPMP